MAIITPWTMAPRDGDPNESAEQTALFMWANMVHLRGWMAAWDEKSYGQPLVNLKGEGVPAIGNLFAIPNGAELAKGARGGANMKAQGMRPGVPDIFLAAPIGTRHGLFIEMKRRKGGVVSEDQSKWMNKLQVAGYATYVAHGWILAATCIELYLK